MFIHEIDISCTLKSHKGWSAIHHGLYVIPEGMSVMHKESVCHVP